MPENDIESPTICQIKVTLLGTKPPIWRRLLIPADITLERLHKVIQVAMGWQDCHLHEFRIGKQRFGPPDPMAQVFGGPRTTSEKKTALYSVLDRVRSKARYLYDFGDDWDHEILLEKFLAPEPGETYPRCIAGAGQGPPEDCGGVPGFYDLLDALADPKHPQHDDLVEWMGGEFDPAAFHLELVNQRLRRLQPRTKKVSTAPDPI